MASITEQIMQAAGTLTISVSGLFAMSAPRWIDAWNQYLKDLDGFYQFGIFFLTAMALFAQRRYFNRGNRPEPPANP